MAIAFFFGSALLLVLGFIIGVFTTPYYMSREDKAVEEARRMADGIHVSLSSLTDICDSITRGKGERGNPPDSRFNLLEDIHDHIYKTIIENLKSLLPKEDKDV